MFDLSKYVEPDKLEDAKAELQKWHDDEVLGLKNKISEKIELETSLKKQLEEKTLEAQTAEQRAVVAKAEKDGTGAELKAAQDALAEMIESHKSQLETIKQENIAKDNERAIESKTNEFLKSFVPTKEVQLFMKTEFQNSVEVVDGVLSPKDKALTMEQLEGKFITGEDYSHNVVANVGSGLGAHGGQNAQVTDLSGKNKTAEKAKENGDAIGHLNAILANNS